MQNFSGLVISIFLAGGIIQASPASGSEPIFKLTQQSCTRGTMTVYASSSAVFVESVARGYCITCQAPDWKIVIYSPKSKRFYEENSNRWMSRSRVNLMDLLAQKIADMQVSTLKREMLLGHRVTILQMRQNLETHLRDSKILHEKESGTYYICDDLPLPDKVSKFLVWLYKLPPVAPASGIPLKFDYLECDGGKYMRLNTLSLRTGTFDSTRLKTPSGYKRVDSETMVLLDQSNESALEELWGPRTTNMRTPAK